MSLSQNISLHDENFFSLEALASDPDFLFLSSIKLTDGLSSKSILLNPHEELEICGLESSVSKITFEKDAYDKIREDSLAQIQKKSNRISSAIQKSFSDYNLRCSFQFKEALNERLYNPFTLTQDFSSNVSEIKKIALSNWNFDTFPGKSIGKWPIGLKEFLNKLEESSELIFFNEPMELHEEFLQQMNEYCLNKARENNVEELLDAMKALCQISLKFLKIVEEVVKNINEEDIRNSFREKCEGYFLELMKYVYEIEKERPAHIHMIKNLCDEGGFKITQQTFQTTSITTDGKYIYLYVASSNGGMYKIGTGEFGTVPGKIYHSAQVYRQEEICWVFCKGKLYLRTNNRELNTLEILNADTFKFEGLLQLHCPEIFGHQNFHGMNKNFPLLTDGDYLYVIGKKIVSEKLEQETLKLEKKEDSKEEKIEEKKIEAEKIEEKEGEKKIPEKKVKDKKKEKKRKFIKLCEFILYEFDIEDLKSNITDQETVKDQDLVKELYNSFSGLFTEKECARALRMSKEDIVLAAQWLIDEGEQEGKKKIVGVRNSTLLGQSEVISDIKKNSEIIVRDDSLIFPSNVSNSLWTIDSNQVTLYTENLIKDVKDFEPQERILQKTSSPINSSNLDVIRQDFEEREEMLNSKKRFLPHLLELADSDMKNELLQRLEESGDDFLKSHIDDYLKSKDKNYENLLKGNKEKEKEINKADFLSDSSENIEVDPKLPNEFKANLFKKEEEDDLGLGEENFNPWSFQKKKSLFTMPEKTEKVPNDEITRLGKYSFKGSHCYTFDCSKTPYYMNSTLKICWDPCLKKFYSFDWQWSYNNGNSNSFPALISVSYDFNNYKNFRIFNSDKGKGFYKELFNILLQLQRKRFYRPSVLNRWDYSLGYALVEVLKNKGNNEVEEEKKKCISQKNKLVHRVNKIFNCKKLFDEKEYEKRWNRENKEKSLVEIKKIFAYCVEGNWESFDVILQFCLGELENLTKKVDVEKSKEKLSCVLPFLLLNIKHCDLLGLEKCGEVVGKFEKFTYEILSNPDDEYKKSPSSRINSYYWVLWKCIIQGFEIFCNTGKIQAKWIEFIFNFPSDLEKFCFAKRNLENLSSDDCELDGLTPLCYFYLKITFEESAFQKGFPLRGNLIEELGPGELVSKIDNNTDCVQLFRGNRTIKLRPDRTVASLGRLFIEDIELFNSGLKDLKDWENCEIKISYEEDNKKHEDYCKKVWETCEKALERSWESSENQGFLAVKSFYRLLLLTLNEYEKMEFSTQQSELFAKFFIKLSKCLKKCFEIAAKKIEILPMDYFEKLLKVYCMIASSVGLVVCSSSLNEFCCESDQNVVEAFINLLKSLFILTDQADKRKQNNDIKEKYKTKKSFLKDTFFSHMEGIEQVVSKVFETNHPFERGKPISFQQVKFPGAIGIAAELDKRCQSDNNADFLNITGWYDKDMAVVGCQSSIREGIGSAFRISGKPDLKHPILILGNSLQVHKIL